mmetsp:Transcript_32938/g.60262  ORF Transcript_32938/g.60262 Transcript_32938/m.60262 type:complete len:608 (-) Transcript_32938:144-1967(-)
MEDLSLVVNLPYGRRLSQVSASRRPTSARPILIRPQSARSVVSVSKEQQQRPSSARSARSQAGSQRRASHCSVASQGSSGAAMRRQLFKTLCDQIGVKVAQRFTTVQHCFRILELDKWGEVDAADMEVLFRRLNLASGEYLERFLALKDVGLTYDDLRRILGGYIHHEYVEHRPPRPPARIPTPTPATPILPPATETETPAAAAGADAADERAATPAPAAQQRASWQQRSDEAELKVLVQLAGHKAQLKFRHFHDLFRFVDEGRQNSVTHYEAVKFLEHLGFDRGTAERTYKLLDKEKRGAVPLTTFMETFAPVILPGGHWHQRVSNTATPAVQQRRPSSAKPAGIQARPPTTPNTALQPRRRASASAVRGPEAHATVRNPIVNTETTTIARAVDLATKPGKRPASAATASTAAPSVAASGGGDSRDDADEETHRLQVREGPVTGPFGYVPNTVPPQLHSDTYDSHRLSGTFASNFKKLSGAKRAQAARRYRAMQARLGVTTPATGLTRSRSWHVLVGPRQVVAQPQSQGGASNGQNSRGASARKRTHSAGPFSRPRHNAWLLMRTPERSEVAIRRPRSADAAQVSRRVDVQSPGIVPVAPLEAVAA